MPAAGWHPDPSGQHQLRWWDGVRWTEHVSGGPAAAPAAPRPAAAPVRADAVDPLAALVLSVRPGLAPPVVGAGTTTTVLELFGADGAPAGRLVEVVRTKRARGLNAIGEGTSVARWREITTREVRGADGWPVIHMAYGPQAPGFVQVTKPGNVPLGHVQLLDPTQGGGCAIVAADGQWARAGSGSITDSTGITVLGWITAQGPLSWTVERTVEATMVPSLVPVLTAAVCLVDVFGLAVAPGS